MSTPPASNGSRRRRPLNAEGLTSWVVIADATGLSERQVKRIYVRALSKVRVECERRGITYDDFTRYIVARDVGGQLDLPEALIPDGHELGVLLDE